jgi:hypothetical protein
MATTTNYGWDTPDDTDLVKDGAAAIRTLGSSIDTTTKNLNPQTTTGALAYRSATANVNTALPIGTAGQILAVSGGVPAWINNDQGDITEVQAGTGISVASGTGPIPVITNTVATAFDAKGDLIVGTGADAFSRLAVGTNGQVLTADSSEATGLKFATPASGVTFAGCALYKSGNQSIANTTATIITFDSELFDTDSFHSTATNTGRITIPAGKGGYYSFCAYVVWPDGSWAISNATLKKNGTGIKSDWLNVGSGTYNTQGFATIVSAVATDYFEIEVYHNKGSSNNILGDNNGAGATRFECAYLGA